MRSRRWSPASRHGMCEPRSFPGCPLCAQENRSTVFSPRPPANKITRTEHESKQGETEPEKQKTTAQKREVKDFRCVVELRGRSSTQCHQYMGFLVCGRGQAEDRPSATNIGGSQCVGDLTRHGLRKQRLQSGAGGIVGRRIHRLLRPRRRSLHQAPHHLPDVSAVREMKATQEERQPKKHLPVTTMYTL